MSGVSVEEFYASPSDTQIAAQRALALDALGAWDLGDVNEVELLAERENAVFSVAATAGRFVVRVHRAGYHSDDQLRSQVAWMRELADAAVVSTADVVDTRSGDVFVTAEHPDVPEPRQVSLLRFVDGEPLAERLDEADTAHAAGAYGELGRLVATLHRHATGWARPTEFRAFRWDIDGLVGQQPVWGSFWDLELLDEEGKAVMARFRECAAAELATIGTGPERFGLVHNDFLADNLLVGDGAGDLTLLDFDDCGDGWFMFDLSPALVSVSTRDDYPELREAFFARYTEVRPLSESDLATVPLFFALRMATYAGWLDSRSHTRFARDLGPVIVEAAVDVVRRWSDDELDV